MKVKTSIALSEEVLARVDSCAKDYKNRSDFIETAIIAFLEAKARRRRNAQDLETFNRNAEALNAEAEDVLDYQGLP